MHITGLEKRCQYFATSHPCELDFTTPKGLEITPSVKKEEKNRAKSEKRKISEWRKRKKTFLFCIVHFGGLWREKRSSRARFLKAVFIYPDIHIYSGMPISQTLPFWKIGISRYNLQQQVLIWIFSFDDLKYSAAATALLGVVWGVYFVVKPIHPETRRSLLPFILNFRHWYGA